MKTAHKIFCNCKSLSLHGLSVLAVFFLISACATPPKQSGVAITGSAHPHVAKRDFAGAEIEKRLREEYRHWKGTRHCLGGTGSRGIDCSGFVKAVYKDVFKIDLPRTTRAQVRQGQPVSFGKLRAGDLVFFKPPSYPRHVGIYLGGSEFVHASKNKGITLSKIDKYYWGKYYWTARRILSDSDHH
jgi:cell wall-associated NlpC family hydrolase